MMSSPLVPVDQARRVRIPPFSSSIFSPSSLPDGYQGMGEQDKSSLAVYKETPTAVINATQLLHPSSEVFNKRGSLSSLAVLLYSAKGTARSLFYLPKAGSQSGSGSNIGAPQTLACSCPLCISRTSALVNICSL